MDDEHPVPLTPRFSPVREAMNRVSSIEANDPQKSFPAVLLKRTERRAMARRDALEIVCRAVARRQGDNFNRILRADDLTHKDAELAYAIADMLHTLEEEADVARPVSP